MCNTQRVRSANQHFDPCGTEQSKSVHKDMDATLQKALLDRVYDKRKAATLDLERQVRECLARGDRARVHLIVQQLCSFLTVSPQNVNARNGGLIGLAGIAIALGVEIAPFLEQIAKPVLACFNDPDSKIRYFACESFYNIAKVCKGEILVFFNETFDALSKLAADSELSVKNGAELLDRLLKDIVCEAAPHYVSQFQDIALIRAHQDATEGVLGGNAELDVAREKANQVDVDGAAANKVFSLARFIPLLSERMYVISPFTRNYLVSWITVLGSVPELELVSYLPAFLDGLLKYLSDPNSDVRVATANVLADFLREIQQAAEAASRRHAFEATRSDMPTGKGKALEPVSDPVDHGQAPDSEAAKKVARIASPERATETGFTLGSSQSLLSGENAREDGTELSADQDVWVDGTEVRIDYAAIMEILITHIGFPDEETQATTLQWIAEFLLVVKDVVVPFTPRLLSAILPSLAHHSPAIASAAHATNINLYRVIQDITVPTQPPAVPSKSSSANNLSSRALSTPRGSISGQATPAPNNSRPRPAPSSTDLTSAASSLQLSDGTIETQAATLDEDTEEHVDPFDYQMTVHALTLQLVDEHEETRVTALEWLLMLHHKSPRKILSMDDGTFPALLKTLSDSSDDVIRCDLRLLAQISSASEDSYFHAFMANLLNLFSTDRRLLETRGSLIIRQLCASLHTERILRTLAEILEKEEDLEFASIMVQNLNVILITSPELADFRRKLRNLDARDGQMLFASIYRSWCHNAVAAFSLCLLAQAYEHASNLLTIFAELEITVSLLIQIDKLVQLLESPIFTALRLQLLEPERYPYLFKCLYGILMLLPQSSAFVTLRNRLNAVNGLGFLHSVPRSTYAPRVTSKVAAAAGAVAAASTGSTTSTTATPLSVPELKWTDLLNHFRNLQNKHERARRQTSSAASGAMVNAEDAGSRGVNSAPSLSASRTGGAGRTRAGQTASASAGSLTPSNSTTGRFGLGLSNGAGASNRVASGATIPSSTSSFFGMNLPSVSSATSIANIRSASPSTARRQGAATASVVPGSRNPSKGSNLR